jgi:hypothetical protein
VGQAPVARNRRRHPCSAALSPAHASARHVTACGHAGTILTEHAGKHAESYLPVHTSQVGDPDQDATADRYSDAIALLGGNAGSLNYRLSPVATVAEPVHQLR